MAVQAKVYVVDDDQGMRDSTVWLLQSVGLQALPFAGGQAFLDACVDDGPACVLLDVRMPGLGGLAVQQAMRERGLGLPVIFVSGHADVPIVVRAFKAGACDFIEKPYNDQLLLDSVQAALESAGRARQDDQALARLRFVPPRQPQSLRARLGREAAGVLRSAKRVLQPPGEPTYRAAMARFIRAINEGGVALPDLQDGYRALEVVLGARRAR